MITNGPGGTMVTGEHIELYRLLAIRGVLKLHLAGLRGRVSLKQMRASCDWLHGRTAAEMLECVKRKIEQFKKENPCDS